MLNSLQNHRITSYIRFNVKTHIPHKYLSAISDELFTNTSFHLVSNICISFQIVFLSLHVRMFRCKQHNLYTSQHITRTVSTTVYGIDVFWLQGMYTREFFASTWVNPPSCWWDRCCSSFFFVFCGLFLFFFVFGLCVVCPMLPVFLNRPFGFLYRLFTT